LLTALDITDQDLISHFDDAVTFVNKGMSVGAVLIHCDAGISRSPTIAAAYLMKVFQLSADEALQKLQQKRHGIYPNEGPPPFLFLETDSFYVRPRKTV
jgi:protein-tyrosine phosphatase